MAGKKHDLEGMQITTSSPLIPMFEAFRDELDEHHDRRERILKASRDITALSKKNIFSLQRVRQLQSPIPSSIRKEINDRSDTIKELFTSVGPDLQGLNAWRYQRQISSGCQEFVEAISFQHYLETQNLITHHEAQDMIPGGVELTADDYVLGLFDLTGELMRFGITSMATSGTLPRGPGNDGNDGRDILVDLRSFRISFESLDTSFSLTDWSPLKRDLVKKIDIMRQSVEKVENAVYGMIIRGRERPKGWVPDINEGPERGREPVESY
ncbi:MAG: hypothetical protein LQ341_004825 [Variospora aurantia]|nr:MAG: hypothetical protein LQ341_004825 [Variospora aurantia]